VFKSIWRGEKEANRTLNRLRCIGTDQKAVPWYAQFRTLKAKDICCNTQLKRIDGIVNENGNGMHGSFLLLLVFSATGRRIRFMAEL
jgi:hypothetical protein